MINPAAFALESATSAELGLFAVYLLSGAQRRSRASYLLAGLTACLALMMAGNILAAYRNWPGLPDAVLFLDLLAPPLVYLYAIAMRPLSRTPTVRDMVHVLPAIAGLAIWVLGLVRSMDLYVNACWSGYLAAFAWTLFGHYREYAPMSRQRFLVALLAVLVSILLLRLMIVLQAAQSPAFQEGLPYLMILAVTFGLTCAILFVALRHPELLDIPGSHLKYGLLDEDRNALERLSDKIDAILSREKPFLDPDFSLTELAVLADTPQRHVSQAINLRHGANVSAHLNALRAAEAACLLTSTEKPVKVVMFESGFRSKSGFNREFQRNYAVSPSEFRRRAETER